MHTATSSDKINLSSENKTEELAVKISKKLKLGDIVFLYGEMGVGKTTFIKYLIQEFQKKNKIKLTEVTSPTFNLLNEYQVKDLIIKHYDLFRLKDKSEIENLDLFENYKNSLTLIEWPQLIKKKKSINSIDLIFTYEDEFESRFVKINGLS